MSGEIVGPASAKYVLKPREEAQRQTLDAHQEDDDRLVQITFRQAQKIAAIMRAVAREESGYTEALHDGAEFLFAVVGEERGDRLSRPSATWWARVNSYAWPQRGIPATKVP